MPLAPLLGDSSLHNGSNFFFEFFDVALGVSVQRGVEEHREVVQLVVVFLLLSAEQYLHFLGANTVAISLEAVSLAEGIAEARFWRLWRS